jgi:hypothetical protein
MLDSVNGAIVLSLKPPFRILSPAGTHAGPAEDVEELTEDDVKLELARLRVEEIVDGSEVDELLIEELLEDSTVEELLMKELLGDPTENKLLKVELAPDKSMLELLAIEVLLRPSLLEGEMLDA